jgi:hypothetical protein
MSSRTVTKKSNIVLRALRDARTNGANPTDVELLAPLAATNFSKGLTRRRLKQLRKWVSV